MRFVSYRLDLKYIAAFVLVLIISCNPCYCGIIEGTVYNTDSGEPVPFTTIRVVGTGHSMVANEQGEYRLRLKAGNYQLKFSHIAHYSEKVEVSVPDSAIRLDIRLRPSLIQLKPLKVYQRAYDPAQRIIIEAISRKEEILSQIDNYSFEAYTRVVLHNTSKPDSSDIMVIAESQLVYYWEQPNKYKEIIIGRKQTANIQPDQNLVAVGGVLNLNQNRININEYSIVSPTAKDALKHYNYYLLDTIYIDDRAVFRLEIEPKSNSEPLFAGIIDIADSFYVVAGVDIGFNEALDLPFVKDLRFKQSFAEFEDDYWMPIEQRISGLMDFSFPGIPVFTIDYVAALHNYRFNTGHPEGTFDEYALEVTTDADDIDSVAWQAGQLVPMTAEESRAYERIDSVANAPKPLLKKLLRVGLGAMFIAIDGYDFFHFNRVEGAYLGLGYRKNEILPRLGIHLKTGWAFSREYWQHNYGFDYTLSERQRLKVGLEYHDEIVHRPTVISRENANYTFQAVTNKSNPFDYYLEKGFKLKLETKLLNHTRLALSFCDYDQFSVSNSTEYSLFRKNKKYRTNPPITDGKMRSIGVDFIWDSRRLMKSKDEEIPLYTRRYIILKVGVEYASSDFIDNDFDFRRYYVSIKHRQPTLGLGRSSILLYAGASDGALPPQRYFTVDFGDVMPGSGTTFETVGESNFAGNRVAVVYLEHDFGRILFRKSRLPLIRGFPYSLSVHGGQFWTEFKNHENQPGDEKVLTAGKPFQEIGFGLGNLPLMNMKIRFTWKLSDHKAEIFSFGMDFEF